MRIVVLNVNHEPSPVSVRDALRQAWLDFDKPRNVVILHQENSHSSAVASFFAVSMGFESEARIFSASPDNITGLISEVLSTDCDICLLFTKDSVVAHAFDSSTIFNKILN